MARRRIWRNRNKPEAEKERRRQLNKEKKARFAPKGATQAKKTLADPELKMQYLALSPMMKATVDSLMNKGFDMEQVINGISN